MGKPHGIIAAYHRPLKKHSCALSKGEWRNDPTVFTILKSAMHAHTPHNPDPSLPKSNESKNFVPEVPGEGTAPSSPHPEPKRRRPRCHKLIPMRRSLLLLALLSSPAFAQTPTQTPPPAPAQAPQQSETPYSLSTQSNLVFVPTEVRTKKGELIFGLTADKFIVEDAGKPQRIHLEEDLGNDGLSLVIVAQCSGAAAEELQKLRGLPTMLDALTGGAPHEIAVVTYGDDPTLVGDFTSDPNTLSTGLAEIRPCDETHVRTFDAVAYANSLLNRRPASMRHAILLLSETRDHGSHTDPKQLIATLGRSNTVVDAVAFSPGRDEVLGELKHGGGGGIVELFFLAINSLRKNAAHELASHPVSPA